MTDSHQSDLPVLPRPKEMVGESKKRHGGERQRQSGEGEQRLHPVAPKERWRVEGATEPDGLVRE